MQEELTNQLTNPSVIAELRFWTPLISKLNTGHHTEQVYLTHSEATSIRTS